MWASTKFVSDLDMTISSTPGRPLLPPLVFRFVCEAPLAEEYGRNGASQKEPLPQLWSFHRSDSKPEFG
jgi:hypothetical protein